MSIQVDTLRVRIFSDNGPETCLTAQTSLNLIADELSNLNRYYDDNGVDQHLFLLYNLCAFINI